MPLEFGGYNDLLRAIRGNVGDIEATRGKMLQNQATALDIQGKQNELQQYPENLNWLRESREQERTKFAQAQETYQYMLKMRPFEQALREFGIHQNLEKFKTELLKNTVWENLDEAYDWGKSYADELYKSSGKGDVAPPMPVIKRETFLKAAGGDETKARELFEKWKVGGKEQKEQSEYGQYAMDIYGLSYDKLNPAQKADIDAKVEKKIQGKSPKESEEMVKYNAWLKTNPGKSYEDFMVFKRALDKNGFSIEMDPETGRVLRITQGNVGTDITPKEKGKLQEETGNLLEQISVLKKAGADFKKEYLTYYGAGKKFVLSKLSKAGADIGEEGKDFLSGRRAFIERIERFFNMYRKEITGAQAVMKELDMLRESVINKEMSPDEFEASYNRFMDDAKTALELKSELMQKGFSGKELGKKIDELFFTRRNVGGGTKKKKTRKLSSGVEIIEED